MISTRSLGALRVAATLTHCLPRLRARVRVDDFILVDVRAPEPDERPHAVAGHAPSAPGPHRASSPASGAGPLGWVVDGGRVMSPCSFRAAVAQAHRRHENGEMLSFLHLPSGVSPSIDIATPRNGAARPGGLYRVRLDDRWLWAFAMTLDARTAHAIGQPLVDASAAATQVVALGIRPDRATGVSLAYAETTADPGTPAEAEVIDLLEGLLARWTMHELLTSTGATQDHPMA